MVIRFTKATRFFCVCILLAVTAVISISTKSISVVAPYTAQGAPLPVVIYRAIGTAAPMALSLRELQADLAYLAEAGYTAVSERDLVAALRREAPLPAQPVLLLFDDASKPFQTAVQPLLEGKQLPWFSTAKSATLSSELRAAGYPVTRLERTAGMALEDLLV